MHLLLLWLALPVLLVVPMASREQRGVAVASLLATMAGIAMFWRGEGSLDPRVIHEAAAQSLDAAWFAGITAGVMIALLIGQSISGNRRTIVPALPLASTLLWAASGAWLAIAAGVLIGLFPLLLGRLLSTAHRRPDETALTIDVAAVALLAITIVCLLYAPYPIAAVVYLGLVWRMWALERGSVIVPATLTALVAAWLWIAVTIAGSFMISLRRFAAEAPISEAASHWFALLALLLAAAGSISPARNRAGLAVRLPVVALLLHFTGPALVPDAIAQWQPLISAALLVATLLAVARHRWASAAAALMLIAASRPGVLPLVAALALSLVPFGLAWVRPVRLLVLPGAVAGGLAIVALLGDQLVLGVLLLLGAAVLLARPARVAPPAMPRHV